MHLHMAGLSVDSTERKLQKVLADEIKAFSEEKENKETL